MYICRHMYVLLVHDAFPLGNHDSLKSHHASDGINNLVAIFQCVCVRACLEVGLFMLMAGANLIVFL